MTRGGEPLLMEIRCGKSTKRFVCALVEIYAIRAIFLLLGRRLRFLPSARLYENSPDASTASGRTAKYLNSSAIPYVMRVCRTMKWSFHTVLSVEMGHYSRNDTCGFAPLHIVTHLQVRDCLCRVVNCDPRFGSGSTRRRSPRGLW